MIKQSRVLFLQIYLIRKLFPFIATNLSPIYTRDSTHFHFLSQKFQKNKTLKNSNLNQTKKNVFIK